MIRTGKKFSKPEMSRVINGDTVLPEADRGRKACPLLPMIPICIHPF